ncbi:hypothetical protein SDC9_54491 [bioreactor metagenome]|uniref:Proteinase inhibitor I42 chagasin domain-containing protein n=1 Tax=bioreactor metagenome TaxID=1076179 RepID=A0A644WWK6_9ZZZZ
MKRRILSASLAVLMLLSLAGGAYASGDDISGASYAQCYIAVNGTEIQETALERDGLFYLPVRAVCGGLGYDISWSQEKNAVILTSGGSTGNVVLNLNDQTVTENGHTFSMLTGSYDAGYLVQNSRTYLSEELFSELFGVGYQFDSTQNTIFLRVLAENSIVISTMKLSSEDENLKVTVQYPQISGLDDNDVQSGINAILRQAAVGAVSEGAQNAYDVMTTRMEYSNYTAKAETFFDYRVKYNQNGLLSLVLLDYQYAGGAHGGTVQKGITFDLSTGKELGFSDLMNGDFSYVSYFDKNIRSEIDKRTAAGELNEISEFTTIGEKPDFYLANDSLVIFFQQYEYFPYAAGIQEFSFSYATLSEMFNSAFGFLFGKTAQLSETGTNALSVGDTAGVTLKGNPTTGYAWYYSFSTDGVLTETKNSYTPDSALTGAGGTYVWNFKAVQPGKTTITFKYYRSWEGETSATAENTVTYNVTVS